MRIHFSGDMEELHEGITLLEEILQISSHSSGFPIEVKQRQGPIELGCDETKGYIFYDKKTHFFRALGKWLEAFQTEESFHLVETPQFEKNGAMIDASRNAVPTVEGVKMLLRRMAVMGLNVLMVYTEDTFSVKDFPYFGYMRGKYTQQELCAMDDVAFCLGIEMVPCIQTLAHLTEALKWNYAEELRDTEDILLVGSEKTYQFLDALIESASSPFRTNRIHIGMDEAHQLGRGNYLEHNPYTDTFSIMKEHVNQVTEITDKYGLEPMYWSDMYFKLGSKEQNYYDLNSVVPKEIASEIPNQASLVYWDYYHSDKDFYRQFIKKHQDLKRGLIFAGGVWTWNGIAPNYGKTFSTTEAALSACKEAGVKEVFATFWGDNGAETPTFSGLLGLQLYAEHGYQQEVDEEVLRKRFAFCTGGNMDDFLLLSQFDETPGVGENNLETSQPSKFMLWQDPLLGLFDENIKGLPMAKHYTTLYEKLKQVQQATLWQPIFTYYTQLANVLSTKSELGIKIKQAYEEKNITKIHHAIDDMTQLKREVDTLRTFHREMWFWTNKAFGWEVLDIRYGGVIVRLESSIHRLKQWLDGEVETLEELHEERLYHDAPFSMPDRQLGGNKYHRIVTASPFSG
ncbi:beta-N-acetylhexosaminidase [Oceanobacillus manasiensis]|uniref:beta-N-acetylhexosaminidase n=1 Tax=Oceanobacillus manasiensis TaxID=586413 RepID=UPI0006942F55|nr:beta-N-acetylhexosaminidase [Oceanobacillus manasiensis]